MSLSTPTIQDPPLRLSLAGPSSDGTSVPNTLEVPHKAAGLVVLAHGPGPSSRNPRMRLIARSLLQQGLGVVLADFEDEGPESENPWRSPTVQKDADHLDSLIRKLRSMDRTRHLRIGIFASHAATASAILLCARQPSLVRALVSKSGMPELASEHLTKVAIPSLLIVGGNDKPRVEAHRKIHPRLNGKSLLQVVGGAGAHFHEPAKLDQVAAMACLWFRHHLATAG